MALFNTIRTAFFVTLLAFSLTTLGLSAYRIYDNEIQGYSTTADPSELCLAVSVITWSFLLPMYIVGIFRRGSFLSWVGIELIVVGSLWALWLASAAYRTSLLQGRVLNCTLIDFLDYQTSCRQTQAALAFSWLCWLTLFGYLVYLFVLAMRAHDQGYSVWISEVTDISSIGSSANQAGPKHEPNAQPMQQNHTHVPYGAHMQYNQPHPPYDQPQPQHVQPVAYV